MYIAALKKRTKYWYLNDVLQFYELDEAQKLHKQAQGARLLRGAVGVTYGNPAHLLDAANYDVTAGDAITLTTIRNASIKADIIGAFKNATGTAEQDDLQAMFLEILRDLESIDESFTIGDLEEFIHADDETSPEYVNAVMDDVNEVLDRNAAEATKTPEAIDSNDEEEVTSYADKVAFVGLDKLYDELMKIEDQLLCGVFKDKVGSSYHAITTSFTALQSKIRAHTVEEKHNQMFKKWQLTLHGAFAKALLPEWKQPLNKSNDIFLETKVTASIESHECEYHIASQFEMSLDEYNTVIPETQQQQKTQMSTAIVFDSQETCHSLQ